MDSIVHFEIPAKDPKRASSFYKRSFGWNFNQYGTMEYWSAITTESDQNGIPSGPGAINGGLGIKAKTAPAAVTVTLRVRDIDKAIERVRKNGGRAKGKKMPVGDMGWAAYFTDTEGNVIGLWQPAKRR